MQFQVPQFIEVEDKIFGPLTFKQFIYIGGGVGAAYLLWRMLPLYVAAPLIMVEGGLAAALAFLQFNGRPFILGLENGFFYFVHSKLYLWNNTRRQRSQKAQEQVAAKAASLYIPKLSDSKLHELAWSLDIKERIAGGITSDEERGIQHPSEDIMAPLRTAQSARATRGESIAQEIERLARERSRGVPVTR
ncbi:MAG: PrgI family protein [bacterium]|nr:PrgI family protein [bacterium]